jgi:hypothetical protein
MRVPSLRSDRRAAYLVLVVVCVAALTLAWIAPAFTFSSDVVYRGF